MAARDARRDLILLVADSNTEYTIKGLLSRTKALGIRPVAFDVFRHPERDPGCLLRGPDYLRAFQSQYLHALVLLDREGSGRAQSSREALEGDLETRLAKDWNQRASAVVLDPELEVWLWSDSPHVDTVLGWHGRSPDLRSWLVEAGLLTEGSAKPMRPKEAVEKALRLVSKPRSSALYRRLAELVSLRRCRDPAFHRFRGTLQGWFPVSGGEFVDTEA